MSTGNMEQKIFLFLLTSFCLVQAKYVVEEEDVQFFLFSLDSEGKFNPDVPTKLIIHGWVSSHEASWVQDITFAYLKKGTHNVVQVDWAKPANFSTDDSADLLPDVGALVGKYIVTINEEEGIYLNDVHIIGHSYGAHVAGFAGKTVQQLAGAKVARITGLDPAYHKYAQITDPAGKLYKDDALIVDAIHTDGDNSGLSEPVGIIDFYPNGGVRPQPGCVTEGDACSHMRATYLFAEEVENENGFISTLCDSIADYQDGLCDDNVKIPMGSELDPSEEGVYFSTTNSEYPYSLE